VRPFNFGRESGASRRPQPIGCPGINVGRGVKHRPAKFSKHRSITCDGQLGECLPWPPAIFAFHVCRRIPATKVTLLRHQWTPQFTSTGIGCSNHDEHHQPYWRRFLMIRRGLHAKRHFLAQPSTPGEEKRAVLRGSPTAGGVCIASNNLTRRYPNNQWSNCGERWKTHDSVGFCFICSAITDANSNAFQADKLLSTTSIVNWINLIRSESCP